MGIPTHGPDCRSLTYPLTCRHCGKSIFFFTCNHGAKTFFENLGWPWRKHNCRSPEVIIANVDLSIEEDYIRLVNENAKRRREQEKKSHIQALKPGSGELVNEFGIIREIVDQVDIYKKFRIPPSTMANASLGELIKQTHVQVTMHTGDITQQLRSYTFFVAKKVWDRYGSIRGDLLAFSLQGRQLLTGESYWYCTQIEPL
jgi:hypothetical protein